MTAVANLAKAKDKEFKKGLENEKKALIAQQETLKDKLKTYGIEIDKIKDLNAEKQKSLKYELLGGITKQYSGRIEDLKQIVIKGRYTNNASDLLAAAKASQEIDKLENELEDKLGELSISFRARTNFDTSKIAVELGGGGHKVASGAKIRNLSFEDAVEKVLAACRKYANKKD